MIEIRPANSQDTDAIWAMLEPVIRAGETYALPRDWSRQQVIGFWFGNAHDVFVAVEEDNVVGTYFLRPNQLGGGAHIANCGYVTNPKAQGRGVARTMLEHSLDRAKEQGYRAMQFNFIVACNTRAVKLWEAYGFETVGRLPKAFEHPCDGYVDALIMHRML